MVLPYRDFVARDAGGPRPNYFYIITTLHATIGTAALLFGVFVVLRANKLLPKFLQFNNYKGFMRLAYTLYMLATLIGIWVYATWFTRIPNPPIYQ